MDFPTLRARVQSYCARSDTTFTNMVETFVSSAEDRIYNGSGRRGDQLYSAPLRVKEMEIEASLTTNASGAVSVPSGFLSAVALSVTDQDLPLRYVPPATFNNWTAIGYTGEPLRYTVVGTQIRVSPPQVANLMLVYYAKPTAISVETPNNDVLTAYPSLYIAATLFEAFLWMREEGSAVQHLARAKSAIDGANRVALDTLLLSGAAAPSFEPIG